GAAEGRRGGQRGLGAVGRRARLALTRLPGAAGTGDEERGDIAPAPRPLIRRRRRGRRSGAMDFDFSDEQRMLRDLAREFLTEQCPVGHVRAMMADPTGYDPAIYRRMADLGLLGLPF